MRHQGLAVFVLFFGLSLLEAVQGQHWIRAAFWLCLGFVLIGMDRPSRKTKRAGESADLP